MDASLFTPDPTAPGPGNITIVALSRLVYRKGIDLLAEILPELCYLHPNVNFIIGRHSPTHAPTTPHTQTRCPSSHLLVGTLARTTDSPPPLSPSPTSSLPHRASNKQAATAPSVESWKRP